MGSWILGKQASKTSEQMPEADDGEQRNGSGRFLSFFIFYFSSDFGSLKGKGNLILGKQGSKTSEWVAETGTWGQRKSCIFLIFFLF